MASEYKPLLAAAQRALCWAELDLWLASTGAAPAANTKCLLSNKTIACLLNFNTKIIAWAGIRTRVPTSAILTRYIFDRPYNSHCHYTLTSQWPIAEEIIQDHMDAIGGTPLTCGQQSSRRKQHWSEHPAQESNLEPFGSINYHTCKINHCITELLLTVVYQKYLVGHNS